MLLWFLLEAAVCSVGSVLHSNHSSLISRFMLQSLLMPTTVQSLLLPEREFLYQASSDNGKMRSITSSLLDRVWKHDGLMAREPTSVWNEETGFKPWLRTLCCVLGQVTIL